MSSESESTPILNEDRSYASNESKSQWQYYIVQLSSLIFVAVSQYFIWKDGYNFFNFHPTFAILFFFFAIQAILILQNAYTGSERKAALDLHKVFQTLAFLSFISSFYVIFSETKSWGNNHFTSPHGKLGLFILISFTSVLIFFGIGVNFFPSKVRPFYKVHRLAGYGLLSLILLNIFFGLELGFSLHSTSYAYIIYPAFIVLIASIFNGVDKRRLF